MTASIRIDPGSTIGPVPRRLFGTFVEHMGRSVYGGIHDPAAPTADQHGFRADVLELVRELGATAVRYPGGNFVSGYRWEDGVGPVEERPTRLEPAWRGIEPNTVGLHEFAEWADEAGLELVEAVNLGTRGPAEAAELLEYANHPGGTTRSDERRSNGADAPFDIRVWCLGNEMDGPWQIGHKTADEYGRLAAETARLMRFIDPRVELVAAGSSNAEMPTFGVWERTVLRHTAGLVDHVSVHAYYEEQNGDVASFLASAVQLDRYLDDVAAIVDEVALETGTAPVGISVDEWNVWNQTRWNDVDKPRVLGGDFAIQPVIEDDYTVTDAVVVGSLLIALLRHADRVTMANLAQLVNVIAPIRCEPDGPAWRQSTYFPFQATARHARGVVVRPEIAVGRYATARYGEVPIVDAVATMSGDAASVFVVNRSLDEPVPARIELPGRWRLIEAVTLDAPDGADRHLTNRAGDERVRLRPLDGVRVAQAQDAVVEVTLPELSWTMIRLARTEDAA
ncbi:alpha-L-arabinofuranosidase C-terminal domain-containing protein [Agromyces humatus]|uniref:non-reducing end alpha-L-arabinofuranosidase n=1 Tax=Agromyces humatus TaxID=279573 RepID=A0ABP4WD95_9MICO|nr:alpha-L-arabinofuranosidase C-terminal domain-containing protein [Agromyces humatus]